MSAAREGQLLSSSATALCHSGTVGRAVIMTAWIVRQQYLLHAVCITESEWCPPGRCYMDLSVNQTPSTMLQPEENDRGLAGLTCASVSTLAVALELAVAVAWEFAAAWELAVAVAWELAVADDWELAVAWELTEAFVATATCIRRQHVHRASQGIMAVPNKYAGPVECLPKKDVACLLVTVTSHAESARPEGWSCKLSSVTVDRDIVCSCKLLRQRAAAPAHCGLGFRVWAWQGYGV